MVEQPQDSGPVGLMRSPRRPLRDSFLHRTGKWYTPADTDEWLAAGRKHYIGNANAACLISILAKKSRVTSSKRSPLVFFACRRLEAQALCSVCTIRTLEVSAPVVGEFEGSNTTPMPVLRCCQIVAKLISYATNP